MKRPDYGIDAPGVIRNLLLAGAVFSVMGIFLPDLRAGGVNIHVRPMFYSMGFSWLVTGLLMVVYVKAGKFRHRDRMLGMIAWRGDETVLDVGTGRGLLMIGAAKRLTTGKSFGIDLWSGKDLSGNAPENTLENGVLEGVREKIEVVSGDATKMDFPDGRFDVILSNLCLHNIPSAAGRAAACREIARTLKPGGVALVSDFIKTGEYAKALQDAGLQVSRCPLNWLTTFPPLRILRAERPA